MSYYPALKQRLTCREVAPRYGLKVNAAGMALCPFHDERSPSLKFSRGFYCFGCGAQGDVITFVSRLFEISPGEAAQKLSVDFGILVDDPLRLYRPKWRHGFPMRRKFFTATTICWSTGSGGIAQKRQTQIGTRCLSKRFKGGQTFASWFLNWGSELRKK